MRVQYLSALLAALIIAACGGSSSAATLSFVGFDLYSSTSTGASSDDPIPGGFRWSSNSSEDGDLAREQLTETSPAGGSQTKGISYSLVQGDNVFTFDPDPDYPPGGSYDPGSYAGVNLFFNDTGVSYNPSGTGIAGNLAAFVPTNVGSPTVSYPASGVQVDDYGPGINVTSYGGATSFVLDGLSVTVTALSVTTSSTGSITINVSPVPEPAALAICSIGTVGLLKRRGRRRSFT